ncbi:MAG TPA: outer membrane lipoprotein-sorting protein [Deltaproteobacteria bacterium]|nr:outer membrane lipoprotein-sorting protein [Deltaproteobacteria bacterium]
MKKSFLIVGLIAIWLFNPVVTHAVEPTGREVMEKQKEFHKVQTEIGDEVMLLIDKEGGREKRQVKRYAKEVGNDIHHYLVVFLSPADIRGTALLTWEQKERENDQWLYLPAQKKMQRIAKGSKKNYFMGTDFTYEDMEPEDLDSFTYTILRTEKLEQDDAVSECYVIESVPANDEKRKESGYSKRIMWIENKYLYTLKVEFYDRRGRLQKVQTNHAMENVSGTIWRAKKTLMSHLEREHKTLTSITARQINTDVDNSVFTERYILTGKHTQ